MPAPRLEFIGLRAHNRSVCEVADMPLTGPIPEGRPELTQCGNDQGQLVPDRGHREQSRPQAGSGLGELRLLQRK